ncbi:glycosyl hydrolase family 28-related protein [Streptomyces sp. B1866]|uniref:glycosyl hydrolase family 28-related protein n=1 Tax=Streptomyces sp. B1866 TaxID=3075431 RepID=UPI00288FD313|nr:glycosyl hydrolase family 28-related protein [Streptomyces sp. B1866]MDT3399560.1 glycosyl hydrolase family 28-related protein [Streptomyces sp. B1866]
MDTAVVAVDVQAGDVLCPALDPQAPTKLTRATHAALTAGTMVTGVAATAAAAGGTVSYYGPPLVAPAGVTGLGPGLPTAVVADGQGRCARQFPVPDGAFVVGACDARGALTVAPKHDFANVLDFGAKGDDQSDDWDAITRAMRSLHPLQPGVLYFPAGYYRVSRPLVVDRERGRIELRGESEHTTTIRLFGPHGPALCVSPKTVGHLPTADALLTGNGGAGVLSAKSFNTVNLRDSPALDMDGAASFSVSCTVRPDELPGGGGGPVLTSSGRRLISEARTCAFGIFLGGTTGKIKVTATARLDGRDYGISHPGAFPVGQTLHLALVWDGTHLDLHAGPPGTALPPAQPPQGQRPPAGAKLTQPVEEGVYLGALSYSSWPEYQHYSRSFTGRIDSIRISDFVIDRDTATRTFTAPTAKFPADFAGNVKPDPADPAKRLVTRMLINFDRDVDAFTVGSTWSGQSVDPAPVFLMHQWSDGIPANAITTVQRLEFQSLFGAGIHGQLSVNSAFSHIRVTASRDGIRLRNNSYLADVDHLYVNASRLGLTLGGSGLASVNRLSTAGTQYDFVATGVVSVTARDWYIGSHRSIVPLLLNATGAYYGFFHGTGIAISSESVANHPQTWQAAVTTTGLAQFTLESSVLETSFLSQLDCPPVIIDESLVPFSSTQGLPSAATFVNCEFRPSRSARANIVFTGRRGPTPVRIIGAATNPAKPWTLPQHANMVSFLGGCVSTTDSGQTQWQGGRDWVFALDTTTGRIGARERETQGSGTASATPARLAAVPLAAGASRYRAEVMATDAAGRAATWVVEQGLTTTGGTAAPWAPETRVLDSFGSAEGSVPTGWDPPQIVASGPNAVVECSAPPGLTLAYTVKLQTIEGLSAS